MGTMQAPQLRMIDPATIEVASNVRQLPTLDPDFLDSVRELGVLSPVVVNETAEGGYVLRFGQRRTLAAVAVERPTIPALVYPAADATDEATAQRLIEQWAENEHRAPVTDADRVGAVEQLALLGVPAKDIAKRLHTTKATAEAANAVIASKQARDAMQANAEVTIEQAAIIADFEDDPDAVEALVAAVTNGRFDHIAQRLTSERAATQAVSQRIEELRAEGTTALAGDVLDADDDSKHTRVDSLRTPTGDYITEEDHAACPGHAVVIGTGWGGRLYEYPVCSDPAQYGHTVRDYSTGGGKRGPMTDAEKAERKRLIANNKAYEDTVVVRAAWIEKFAKGKGPVKGGEAFVAQALIVDTHERRKYGRTAPAFAKNVTARTQPARALRIAVALLLDEWHQRHDKRDTWRNRSIDAALYLTAMESWGYELSEVELNWRAACTGLASATEEDDEPTEEESGE